jgi:predicted MFS family arabinose efflux permease
VGLLLGGVLTETLSWEWIFFVNIPIGIAGFLASLRFVPESRAEQRPGGADFAGAASVTSGLIVLVYTIVKARDFGWGSLETLGLGALAIALLAAFVAIEHRSAHPLVRLSVFRVRTLAVANGAMLLVISGMFAMFFFASLYVQEILGYSPIEAGLAFLPVTAGIMIGAGAAQGLVPRIGVRNVGIVGMLMAATGLALLSGVPTHGSFAADLLPGLMLISVGMGLTFVPLTLIATTGVDDNDAGLASGLFNTSQQVGGALGLAILSTLAANKTTDVIGGLGRPPAVSDRVAATVDGFQVAFAAGAGLIFLAAILLFALIRPAHVRHISADPAALAGAAA